MNKRQAKKRIQREVWINWCGEEFKMPFLMKWKQVKFYNKLSQSYTKQKARKQNEKDTPIFD